MKKRKDHIEALESYLNGNISTFKAYLKEQSALEIIRLAQVSEDFNIGLKKIEYFLES